MIKPMFASGVDNDIKKNETWDALVTVKLSKDSWSITGIMTNFLYHGMSLDIDQPDQLKVTISTPTAKKTRCGSLLVIGKWIRTTDIIIDYEGYIESWTSKTD